MELQQLQRTAVDAYFDDIAASSPLDSNQEAALAERIQQGDLVARNQLIQANLRFVVRVAAKYQHQGLPLEDLISIGNLGLIKAAQRFDGSKGYKFITYAVWWIRHTLRQALDDQASIVRVPAHQRAQLKAIEQTIQRLEEERAPTVDAAAVARNMAMPVDGVVDTLLNCQSYFSLDQPLEEGNDGFTSIQMVADTSQEAPDAAVMRSSAQSELSRALNQLDLREREIIRRYFGLDGCPLTTLEEIGKSMGFTRERARQLKDRALDKLRHPSRAKYLKTLVHEN